MKIDVTQAIPEFRPITVTLTLQTQEEANTFYELSRNGGAATELLDSLYDRLRMSGLFSSY